MIRFIGWGVTNARRARSAPLMPGNSSRYRNTAYCGAVTPRSRSAVSIATRRLCCATDQDLVTLVNVFTVEPERHAALLNLLVDATTSVINQFPGYVSANIHRSLDGTKVVNYAQWRSVGDYEAKLADPSVRQHLSDAAAAAISFDPHLYRVEFTDQAPGGRAMSSVRLRKSAIHHPSDR